MHDFGVIITKNPITSGAAPPPPPPPPPRPPASEIHLCIQTPLSENPGPAPDLRTTLLVP